MPSEPDKAKRWQFGMRRLICPAVVIPPLIACAVGVFGEQLAVIVWSIGCFASPLVAIYCIYLLERARGLPNDRVQWQRWWFRQLFFGWGPVLLVLTAAIVLLLDALVPGVQ